MKWNKQNLSTPQLKIRSDIAFKMQTNGRIANCYRFHPNEKRENALPLTPYFDFHQGRHCCSSGRNQEKSGRLKRWKQTQQTCAETFKSCCKNKTHSHSTGYKILAVLQQTKLLFKKLYEERSFFCSLMVNPVFQYGEKQISPHILYLINTKLPFHFEGANDSVLLWDTICFMWYYANPSL